MAFAVRSLRVLCKACSGNSTATYSTLREFATRTSFVQLTQKCRYTSEATNRPKITTNLTNIQTTTHSLAHETLLNEKKSEGQKEDEQSKEYTEFSKKAMRYGFAFFGTLTTLGLGYMVYATGKPQYDEHGNLIEDEFSHLSLYRQMYERVKKELIFYKKFIQEPSREKLLPDPVKYPYVQPPYTLVLEMTGVLVHPDWTYQTGWRFKKRPGVDFFLEAVAPPQFEIVVYTADSGMTVFPILDALDPNGWYIMYRLFRDATRFVNGHHVKDLDALNRDLSKVIVVDWNPESVKLHPENALTLPKWTGNDDDTTLYDLAAFLKTILASNVKDVRDVLNYYRQFDNPLEAFKENQRKLLLQLEEQKEQNKETFITKWRSSFLRNR